MAINNPAESKFHLMGGMSASRFLLLVRMSMEEPVAATLGRAHSSRAQFTSREPGPDECPAVYASTCKGTCLEPVYHDGVCLVFSKTERAAAGDFVGVWLQSREGTIERRVKRLAFGLPDDIEFPFKLHPLSEAEPLVILEQLNPALTYCIPATKVIALHKVIGEAESNGDGTARLRQREAGQ